MKCLHLSRSVDLWITIRIYNIYNHKPYNSLLGSHFNRKWNTFLSFLVHVIKIVQRCFNLRARFIRCSWVFLFVCQCWFLISVYIECEYDKNKRMIYLCCLTCLARFNRLYIVLASCCTRKKWFITILSKMRC